VVIPNGIELRPWTEAVPVPRPQLQLENDAFVIGCVGRLDAAKAHDVLVDAVAAAQDPRWTVLLAGDGPLRDTLQTQARDRGVGAQFRWLGFFDDVPGLLAAADVYVQPSRYEGHSMALLEAMASGRACVVSDIPELAGAIGDAGCVAAAGDAGALARALGLLQADPARRAALGRAARERVQQHSIEASAERYLALYREIAAQRGRARR
jgi:glycosyltransferase involved in cell wall biosynthesis